MNKLNVISGEAPETDSEDECGNPRQSDHLPKGIKGVAVHGEDSESEDDGNASVASVASNLNQQSVMTECIDANNKKLPEYHSLLHQKMREANLAFQTDYNDLCSQSVKTASNQLNDTEQNLLQSQMTLQSAVNSLRNLSAHSTALRHKLEYVLTSKFIGNIKTSK